MNNVRRYLVSYIHSFANKYYHRRFLFGLANKIGLYNLDAFHHNKIKKTYFRNLVDIKLLSGIDCSKMVTRELWNEYYKKRYFNVLGTGWVKWAYDEKPIGFEGIRIDSEIREDFKTEIAWCRDMRTGYCFNQNTLSNTFFDDLERGADVKVPWEMARMYHWPQLALLAASDIEDRNSIIDEFVFEIEDFWKIPIGKSIQYSCAMEIAIRAVNLLIAFDVFTQIDYDNRMCNSFKEKFITMMWGHWEIILNKLEINLEDGKNGNHYLANLCGLLFLCSYLQGRKTKKCLKFAIKEFFKEIEKQFLQDGSNFECSTAYHRLAAELSILGIMMIEKSGKTIPDNIQRKLLGMHRFLRMIEKPNGRLLQIGDNDSGRVLYLNPKGKYVSSSQLRQYNINWERSDVENKKFFVLDELSVAQVIAMFDAFFGVIEPRDQIVFCFCKSMIGSRKHDVHVKNFVFENNKIEIKIEELEKLPYKKRHTINFPKVYNIKKENIYIAECFGLIVIKIDDFFLAIRTVPEYRSMRLGHVHNDIFHFELSFEDKDYFSDPGSYVYTGDREWRDKFRSDKFHNVPLYTDKWIKSTGMFSNIAEVSGKWNAFHNEIILMAVYKNVTHVRRFILYNNKLTVKDYSNQKFELNTITNTRIYSLGYGMRNEE